MTYWIFRGRRGYRLKRSDRAANQNAGALDGMLKSLHQGIKLLDRELSGFENMRQCASFYWAVGGNRDFQHAFRGSFLQADVASSLSNHHKPGALKRFDNPGRKISWAARSQNDFPNLFPNSRKIVVYWFKIELNRFADVL